MKREYTTLTRTRFCEACAFIKNGGKSRLKIPHTCGKDDAGEVGKELKSLRKNKKLFNNPDAKSTRGMNTQMLWVPDTNSSND